MHLLVRVLRTPELMTRLTLSEWEDLLRTARAERLSATLQALADGHGVLETIPEPPRAWLDAERTRCDFVQRQIRNELAAVRRTLGETEYPIVLLKGAAYIGAALPSAPGRFLSDLDMLVPHAALDDIEARLVAGGWGTEDLDDYDQRYYREWSHELPPLTSPIRGVEVDIHHNITQPTGRLKVEAQRLFEGAAELSEAPWPYRGLFTLSQEDMVLHSATHLFFNDELRGGLRDIWDLHRLCQTFSAGNADFWHQLGIRSRELGLRAPLWFALRHIQYWFQAEIPDELEPLVAASGATALRSDLTFRLTCADLRPGADNRLIRTVAGQCLYLRSHWIRMPPGLLARHVIRKGWKNLVQGLQDRIVQNEYRSS